MLARGQAELAGDGCATNFGPLSSKFDRTGTLGWSRQWFLACRGRGVLANHVSTSRVFLGVLDLTYPRCLTLAA